MCQGCHFDPGLQASNGPSSANSTPTPPHPPPAFHCSGNQRAANVTKRPKEQTNGAAAAAEYTSSPTFTQQPLGRKFLFLTWPLALQRSPFSQPYKVGSFKRARQERERERGRQAGGGGQEQERRALMGYSISCNMHLEPCTSIQQLKSS